MRSVFQVAAEEEEVRTLEVWVYQEAEEALPLSDDQGVLVEAELKTAEVSVLLEPEEVEQVLKKLEEELDVQEVWLPGYRKHCVSSR